MNPHIGLSILKVAAASSRQSMVCVWQVS